MLPKGTLYDAMALPLDIEMGWYNRTPLESRICQMNSIESELHFLQDYPLYDDYRAGMINKALEVDEQFLLKNKEEQIYFKFN